MRNQKVIAALLGVGCCLILLVWLLDSKYSRFKRRSPQYHSDFATACDSILAQHQLGIDEFLELSVGDGSLPEIVRSLRPEKIKISPNRVWILVDHTHTDGLVVIWEPQDVLHPKIWNLIANTGEGPSEVVYVARR